MRNSLTEKIRQTRIIKGLSQQNMADELNLTLAGYSKIERGETEMTISRLERISAILEVPIIDFVSNEISNLEEPAEQYGTDLSIAVIKLNNTVSYLQDEIARIKKEIEVLKKG